jgi:hypothetical protein
MYTVGWGWGSEGQSTYELPEGETRMVSTGIRSSLLLHHLAHNVITKLSELNRLL